MARKKKKEDLSAIANLPILSEDSSVQLLLKRVKNEEVVGKEKTTEEKLIILKILALNSMQWTDTANQVGVSRRTLRNWWAKYGKLITDTKPGGTLVQEITNDVAVTQGLSLKKWYALLDKSANKLGGLVDEAKETKSIYAIVEAVKAGAEVLRLNKELADEGKVQGSDFFMGVYNQMIINKYGEGGN